MTFPPLLERLLDDAIEGASEGMFPKNDLGAPDFEETEMLRRTREYIAELPPAQGKLLVLLFLVVELVAPFLLLTPRRFSRLAPAQRARAVRRWRRSRFHLLRMLGDALKASTTMMYMSHPLVVAHIGEHRTCGTGEDGYDVHPDALMRAGGSP